jgi:hypothetical protein
MDNMLTGYPETVSMKTKRGRLYWQSINCYSSIYYRPLHSRKIVRKEEKKEREAVVQHFKIFIVQTAQLGG